MIGISLTPLLFTGFIQSGNNIFIFEIRRSSYFVLCTFFIINLNCELTDLVFPLMAVAFGLFVGA